MVTRQTVLIHVRANSPVTLSRRLKPYYGLVVSLPSPLEGSLLTRLRSGREECFYDVYSKDVLVPLSILSRGRKFLDSPFVLCPVVLKVARLYSVSYFDSTVSSRRVGPFCCSQWRYH